MIHSPIIFTITSTLLIGILPITCLAEPGKPYRLGAVDLKQKVIWGAEVKVDETTGLAFGGQDQTAADGRPHTRLLVNGKWTPIHDELRAKNSGQKRRDALWQFRSEVRNVLAKYRNLFFRGLSQSE